MKHLVSILIAAATLVAVAGAMTVTSSGVVMAQPGVADAR